MYNNYECDRMNAIPSCENNYQTAGCRNCNNSCARCCQGPPGPQGCPGPAGATWPEVIKIVYKLFFQIDQLYI